MAILVSYSIETDGTPTTTDVCVYIDRALPNLGPFERAIRRAHPSLNIMLFRDLLIYNQHEISNNCRVLFGEYKLQDQIGKLLSPITVPDIVVPAYIENSGMIDAKFMDKLEATRKAKPIKLMFSQPLPVDLPDGKIGDMLLSKIFPNAEPDDWQEPTFAEPA